jgi:uncharacterized protein involved in exopolysaccharide biosynthesis
VTQPTSLTADGRTASEWSIASLLVLLASRWKLLIVLAAAGATLTSTVLLILPRTYSSQSSFAPQGAKQSAQFSGIAAQLGVSLPGTDLSSSPQFYADLTRSRTLLRGLVDSVRIKTATGARTLSEIYRVTAPTSAMLREATVDQLMASIAVAAQQRTGVVQVIVSAPEPDVARLINAALLASVNGFNLNRRKSQAGAERSFVERRLAEARRELRATEERLQAFLQENRTYTGSPQLRFEYDRQSADVSLHQSVVTTLAQLVEQSRVDEVRDTPVITVIEPPVLPARPDSRHLVANAAFAFIASLLLATLAVAGSAYWRAMRASSSPRTR